MVEYFLFFKETTVEYILFYRETIVEYILFYILDQTKLSRVLKYESINKGSLKIMATVPLSLKPDHHDLSITLYIIVYSRIQGTLNRTCLVRNYIMLIDAIILRLSLYVFLNTPGDFRKLCCLEGEWIN